MIKKFKSSIILSFNKATRYRANLISWIIADISLYMTLIMTYYLLMMTLDTIGNYNFYEFLFYISTYLLVNNIFAIFFSDSSSHYLSDIINGHIYVDMLRPGNIVVLNIFKNLNFFPLFTTPILILIHIYFFMKCNASFSILYILSIFAGALTMGLLYFILYSFALFGYRIDAISNVIYQFILLSEKPDTIFPKAIRNFLIYIIPAFLFSAIPTRIALKRTIFIENIWSIFSSFILYMILIKTIQYGIKNYQEGIE